MPTRAFEEGITFPPSAGVASSRLQLAAPAILLLLILTPQALADGEPPRINAAVITVIQEDESETIEAFTCIRWKAGSGGDGYGINVYGQLNPINFTDVPFRPGWLMPTPNDCIPLFPFPDEDLSVSISTLDAGVPIATSCNITIVPRTYNSSGFSVGSSLSCGSPAYSHDISLTGTTNVSGADVIYRLNHSLASANATYYQYQFQVPGIPAWFNIEPTTSYTVGAANLTANMSLGAYRQANFTFPGTAGQADSTITWRVRAADTFTYETGQWSCLLDLPTTEGFARACKPPRVRGVDDGTPSLPFVNVANFSLGLGVPLGIGAGILASLFMLFLGGLTAFIGRDITSALAGASIGAVLSFQAALLPGWIVLSVFFFAMVFTLDRFMGQDQ